MSLAEWEAFERGETLINNTDHFDGGKGGSKSVGFCFTEDEPAIAWRYLAGIVDADVWATFDFPDNYLTKSDGKYNDKSEGAWFWRNRQTLWGGCTDANPKLLLNDT